MKVKIIHKKIKKYSKLVDSFPVACGIKVCYDEQSFFWNKVTCKKCLDTKSMNDLTCQEESPQ